MRKTIWFLGALVLIVGFYYVARPRTENKILGTESTSEIKVRAQNQVSFDFGERTITAVWYKVGDPFNLSLIANFDEKAESKAVFASRACKILSNAGFYTENSKPTGFFVSDGVRLRSFTPNILLNGILSVNYLGTPRITSAVPRDDVRIGVQTGPILKENAEYKKLNLVSDKEARRVVAAVNGNNELYFIVFYDRSSAYMGPYLKDLPEVLGTFEKVSNIEFADAVNLDGGSASSFITDDFSLTEVSPVGAFFCEK